MTVVLSEFDVDDAGVPRAQAAQSLANGIGIVWVIELYLPLTIGGPLAISAGIPAGDRRIGSGSKCDAVRHYALLFPPTTKVSTLAHPKSSASDPIRTKKDTIFPSIGLYILGCYAANLCRAARLMIAAPFSAITIVGAFVLVR